MREIKIISLEKRPWYERILSINEWRVEFVYEGKKYKMNAWAGTNRPNVGSLLFDINRYLEKKEEEENWHKRTGQKALIGQTIDLENRWFRDWDKKYL